MSILDKANEYIGHPREVDEGYEVSMRRTAYAQGYKDAMDKACDKLSELKSAYEKDLDAEPRVYERHIQLCSKISLIERLILELKEE
jgi:hypothetical protein